MEKRYCENCGTPLDERNGLCPKCDIKRNNKINNQIIITLIVLIIALIIGVVIYALQSDIFSLNQNDDNSYKLNAIQTTKQDVQTKQETTAAETRTTIETTEEITIVTTTEATKIRESQPEYLFPSDTELLTTEYLDTKSKNEIDLIRNEIYARHGYIFQMQQYYDYFIEKSWYNPMQPDMQKAYDNFNCIEKQNIEILVEYQNLS